MSRRNKKFRKIISRHPKTAAITIIAAGAIAGVVALADNSNRQAVSPPTGTPVIETVPTPSNKTKPLSSKGQNNTTAPTSTPQTQIIPSASLITPYGTFVSNHYPSLSGSSAPSQEESVCTTNPGVKCYIQFTKDGVTKKLPVHITDEAGSTSWTWDVKKSNFTAGKWLITAVVTSGDNSKNKQDSILLTVSK